MANEHNLKHFTSEYQPANRGRKKGSRNLSTILIETLAGLEPGAVIDKELVKKLCRSEKQSSVINEIFHRTSRFIKSTNSNVDNK